MCVSKVTTSTQQYHCSIPGDCVLTPGTFLCYSLLQLFSIDYYRGQSNYIKPWAGFVFIWEWLELWIPLPLPPECSIPGVYLVCNYCHLLSFLSYNRKVDFPLSAFLFAFCFAD